MAQFGKADTAVDASLLFKEVMDHLQQLMAELNELVRRVRHDEKLLEVVQVGFDNLGVAIHVAPNV